MKDTRTKWEKLVDWKNQKLQTAGRFVKENPFVTVIIGTTTLKVVGNVVVAAIKTKANQTLTVYDPSLGTNIPVKPMSASDQLIYKQYLDNGMTRLEALNKMNKLR